MLEPPCEASLLYMLTSPKSETVKGGVVFY